MAVWHWVPGRNRIELIHAKCVNHVTAVDSLTSSSNSYPKTQERKGTNTKKEKKENGETGKRGKRGRKNGSPEGYIQLIIDGNCNSFHDVYIHTTFGTPSSKIEESRERDCGHEPRCWHPPSGLRIDTRTSAFCHFSERPHGQTQYNTHTHTHTHTQCVENRRKEKKKLLSFDDGEDQTSSSSRPSFSFAFFPSLRIIIISSPSIIHRVRHYVPDDRQWPVGESERRMKRKKKNKTKKNWKGNKNFFFLLFFFVLSFFFGLIFVPSHFGTKRSWCAISASDSTNWPWISVDNDTRVERRRKKLVIKSGKRLVGWKMITTFWEVDSLR
jgi:hypothetical protein